jgi:hypothetical protein
MRVQDVLLDREQLGLIFDIYLEYVFGLGSPFVLERTRTSPSAFAAASASSIVNVSPFLLSLPPDGRNSKKRVKARRHLSSCRWAAKIG